MSDTRRKDYDWNTGNPGTVMTWEGAQLAVLMDIRDELKKLNTLLHCYNFTTIPATLRGIRAKLPTRRRKAK
jgi:hypothetical protein